MRIPQRFQLLGHDITVVYGEHDGENDGEWDANKGRITISPPPKSCADIREHTFYHELMHAVLDIAGYSALSEDEAFVDRVSGLLHQFLKTAEYR